MTTLPTDNLNMTIFGHVDYPLKCDRSLIRSMLTIYKMHYIYIVVSFLYNGGLQDINTFLFMCLRNMVLAMPMHVAL